MTRIRYYDLDSPFGAWLRRQKSLPSNSVEIGFVATDIDLIAHCWKRRPTGNLIQCLLYIEVKTRCADFRFSQFETLSALSAFAGQRNFEDVQYRFYGTAFLLLSGTDPSNSDRIVWKRFPFIRNVRKKRLSQEDLIATDIDEEKLVEILSFTRHPISLRKFRPEKSHHGSKVVYSTEMTPLGFEVDVVKRKVW